MTTSDTQNTMTTSRSKNVVFPLILLALYLVLMIWLAIDPYSRATWFAENLPVWIVVGLLVLTYR